MTASSSSLHCERCRYTITNLLIFVFLVFSRDTNLPEISAEVGSAIQPPLLPLSVTHVQSKASETEQHTTKEVKLPDLSKVLYQETYDEYTREKRLVVLASHCWSTQQSMFVGCRGGQLLTVDFDTGVIKTLANPQVRCVGHTNCCMLVVIEVVSDS